VQGEPGNTLGVMGMTYSVSIQHAKGGKYYKTAIWLGTSGLFFPTCLLAACRQDR